MVRRIGLAVAVLGLVTGTAGPARAGITLVFAGMIDAVASDNGVAFGGIARGDAFTGAITFDDAAIPTASSTTAATYTTGLGLSVHLDVSGVILDYSRSLLLYQNKTETATIRDNYADHIYDPTAGPYGTYRPAATDSASFLLSSTSDRIAGGLRSYQNYEAFSLDLKSTLLGGVNDALASTSLAGFNPVLSSFQTAGFSFYSLTGVNSDSRVLSGSITSLSLATAVPEPSTLVSASIAGVMGLGIAWRRRRKASARRLNRPMRTTTPRGLPSNGGRRGVSRSRGAG